MAKYEVTLNAIVTKTIEVEASDENNAEQKASELFIKMFEETNDLETIGAPIRLDEYIKKPENTKDFVLLDGERLAI